MINQENSDYFRLETEREPFKYYFELCTFDGKKVLCEKEMQLEGDYPLCIRFLDENHIYFSNHIEIDNQMEVGY